MNMMERNTVKPTFSEEDKAYARALLVALQPFLDVRPTMPLQYVTTFLRVVADEGKGVSDYATAARISKTVATRHLLDIGERSRDHSEGFGWVYQKRDIHDLRINRTYGTPEGKALWRAVVDRLKTLGALVSTRH